MIPIAGIVGMIVLFGTVVMSAESDIPILKYLTIHYSQAYLFITELIFGILLLPYELLKLFRCNIFIGIK